MITIARRAALMGLAASFSFAYSGGLAAAEDNDSWLAIKASLFDDRAILEDGSVLALEAPYRAHDAAVTPIGVKSLLAPGDPRQIERVHLIIDENPAPLAGVFHMGDALLDASFSTRVRIDAYTHVRAVAETSDGALHMASAFVKASGGCAAPAQKDAEEALARLGEMRARPMTPFTLGAPSEVKVMISHPNYSGMQIDQLTRNWIPPDFVNQIEIAYGDEVLMRIDADISISEDPTFTFAFEPEAAGDLTLRAGDSEGRAFEKSFALAPSS